jgi:hypothetical protein
MLTTLNSELGTPLTFNCKDFVDVYEALQRELDQDTLAYERLRDLVDQDDDYARQIYDDYCLDHRDDPAAKIPSRLFSGLRSETHDLMENQ